MEEIAEVYARARLILLPKDYVRLRLTGVAAMDKADGSGTLLFDLAARDWSSEVLSALAIPRDWLPPTSTVSRVHRPARKNSSPVQAPT